MEQSVQEEDAWAEAGTLEAGERGQGWLSQGCEQIMAVWMRRTSDASLTDGTLSTRHQKGFNSTNLS